MKFAVLALAFALPRIHTTGDTSGCTPVPAPAIEMRLSQASATTVPWIDANGWRFLRGVNKPCYKALPPGSAPLAAAEAFAYGADALLEPAPEDAAPLAAMLKFLSTVDRPPLPDLANIGVIDDGSEEVGEVLNLLSRRNLMYKVVKKADPRLDLNIVVGSAQYPRSALADPNDFAARVREKLSDEKRLVRIYGSYTVLAHLTGDGERARLHLLNYGRRPARDVRVRVLGVYGKVKLAEAQNPNVSAADIAVAEGGTEFSVPQLNRYAVVDLERRVAK